MSMKLDALKQSLKDLRRSTVAGRSRPHKPIMLLAVLDLYEAGELRENQIRYNPGLIERFSKYFEAVAEEGDWCQPAPPFFHLRSAGFWKHKPVVGREAEYAALKTSGGGSRRILDNIDYAYLDEDAFAVITNPNERAALRRFTIETFFSAEEQSSIWKVVTAEAKIAKYQALLETGAAYDAGRPSATARNTAFSRMIRHLYDYQCAMCGLRIIVPDGSTPIDAAHLIPWSETQDDSPTNGIALCKLHHWSLDAGLVAPSIDLKWLVSRRLDRRRNSERELTRFHRARLLLPSDEAFYPRREAILWRLNRLAR